MWLLGGQIFVDKFSRWNTILAHDRQTDRWRTLHDGKDRSMQSVARVKSARTRQRLDVKTCQWLAGTHKTSENRGLLLAQHHLSLQTPAYAGVGYVPPQLSYSGATMGINTNMQRHPKILCHPTKFPTRGAATVRLGPSLQSSLAESTRNSAVADKPRDAFAQTQWRGWPPKTRPSLYVLPCWIWSFCVEWCRHKYRRTQKIGGALEHHSLEMGGVADPQDTRMCIRYGMCYHVRFVSSATKGICINSKEPQNWGALGPRPLGVGVADHLRISSLAVLPCEIW